MFQPGSGPTAKVRTEATFAGKRRESTMSRDLKLSVGSLFRSSIGRRSVVPSFGCPALDSEGIAPAPQSQGKGREQNKIKNGQEKPGLNVPDFLAELFPPLPEPSQPSRSPGSCLRSCHKQRVQSLHTPSSSESAAGLSNALSFIPNGAVNVYVAREKPSGRPSRQLHQTCCSCQQ